jgi:hypothetical protein
MYIPQESPSLLQLASGHSCRGGHWDVALVNRASHEHNTIVTLW